MSAVNTSTRAVSNRSIIVLVTVALFVGAAASLALRPPGRIVSATPQDNNRLTLQAVRWRLPVAYSTELPALGDNIQYVADIARLASGGMTDMTIFEPGKLVPALDITDAAKAGKIEAGYTWLGYDQGKIPASPLFSAVPFGMEPWEFAAWWFEAGGYELAQEVYADHGVHPILCGLIGPETAGWFRDKVESVDDFNGLKIRFAGIGGRVLKEFGAAVSVLPSGELFPALEKGVIDATEFSLPVIDQRLGFDQLVKNNYFPGWHQTFTAFHLVVNESVWASLNKASQASVEVACTAGVLRNLARGEALQGEIIKGFEAGGVQAQRLPESILRQLETATREVLETEAANDALFDKVYRSQRAFSDNYKVWKSLGYLPRDFAAGGANE